MSEAAAPLFRLGAGDRALADPEPGSDDYVREMAALFCERRPYAQLPYSKRNWGGRLHSLCSYQGKLKPSIAHFLVAWFTRAGQTVLDPMAGVGTIPLEARLQGRRALASDLSEFATAVARSKVERVEAGAVEGVVGEFAEFIDDGRRTPLEELVASEEAGFGLNGAVSDYFHPETLREVLLARRFFAARTEDTSPDTAVVLTALVHVLHGNRPYALSRRSHPITPLKPTGDAEYRPLLRHVRARLHQTVPLLTDLAEPGRAYRADFGALPLSDGSVDAVITSPPFAQSLRFFSSNWMRLWFCGWGADAFRSRASGYLERQQRDDFDSAYRRFFVSMRRLVRPGGLLVMHVGATRRIDMAERIVPLLQPHFDLLYRGTEDLDGPESHGLSDKGATLQHSFLFCRAAS